MYDYNYGYDYGYGSSYGGFGEAAGIFGGLAAIGGLVMIISAVVGIIMLVSQWKIYKKAGKGGWECLIPIYNIIVLLQIVELPMWYIALFFVPIANIYAIFKIYIELAHKFGKSTGFGVATVFFSVICLPMLAFGKNVEYNGGNGSVAQMNNNLQPNTQYNPSAVLQNDFNNTNNNASNPNAPFVFDQNVNTQINPIPAVQGEPISVQTPTVNPQPEMNIVPPVAPMEAQPVNNQINPVPTNSQTTPFAYNTEPTPEVTVAQQNETPTIPVAPVTNEVQPQQPVVNPQPVIPEPQVNVIPGMGTTPQPILTPENPGNNPNNTTM